MVRSIGSPPWVGFCTGRVLPGQNEGWKSGSPPARGGVALVSSDEVVGAGGSFSKSSLPAFRNPHSAIYFGGHI